MNIALPAFKAALTNRSTDIVTGATPCKSSTLVAQLDDAVANDAG